MTAVDPSDYADLQEFLFGAPSEWLQFANPEEMKAIGARVSKCHENCETWVSQHPAHRIVRGWIVIAQWLAARHSVVEVADGSLLDVTPRELGQSANIREFKRWRGSEEGFRRAPDQVRFLWISNFG